MKSVLRVGLAVLLTPLVFIGLSRIDPLARWVGSDAAWTALAQLSLFAASDDAKSLILNDVHINSLHYRAYVLVAATGDGRAVIFGGGCAGKVRRKWSSSRRCSGSGWV